MPYSAVRWDLLTMIPAKIIPERMRMSKQDAEDHARKEYEVQTEIHFKTSRYQCGTWEERTSALYIPGTVFVILQMILVSGSSDLSSWSFATIWSQR